MVDTIITAKNNPDLDGVASAIAYAYFLNSFLEKKKYFVAFWWQMQYEALYVLKMLWLQKADRHLDSVLTPDHKYFILVDYSEKEWISHHIIPENVVEVINHKKEPVYDDFPNANFRIEYVWANATLIAEKYFFHQELDFPQKLIDLLYCAIYSNTLWYATQMTWFRDKRMKERLESKWANKELLRFMIEQKTEYTKNHLKHTLRLDDKLILHENWLLVDLFQLEVGDAQWFLDNTETVCNTFSTMHQEHNVLCLLFLHDLTYSKTYVFANFEHILRYLTKEQCFWDSIYHEDKGYIAFSDIFIRKDALPVMKKIFEKIDNSLLLQQFLQ